MKFLLRSASLIASLTVGLWVSQNASALTYELPTDGGNVIGKIRIAQTIAGDTLTSIGRRYSVGLYELKEANPSLDFDKQYGPGKNIIIPTAYILPDTSHKGIVVNLAELRLYLYQPNTRNVLTFPVGVGRDGWNTPLGETYIAMKTKDPTWVVPESIKKAREADGVELPDHVDPGPENPLGGYRLRLGFPNILIHGSNDPSGIGRRSSSGCIRMQPEAIESFYDLVPVHFLVTVVDQPVKVGWSGNDLYVESHVPLTGNDDDTGAQLEKTLHQLVDKETATRPANVDWDLALKALHQQRGYPVKVGEGTSHYISPPVPLNPAPIVKVPGSNKTQKDKAHHEKKHVKPMKDFL